MYNYIITNKQPSHAIFLKKMTQNLSRCSNRMNTSSQILLGFEQSQTTPRLWCDIELGSDSVGLFCLRVRVRARVRVCVHACVYVFVETHIRQKIKFKEKLATLNFSKTSTWMTSKLLIAMYNMYMYISHIINQLVAITSHPLGCCQFHRIFQRKWQAKNWSRRKCFSVLLFNVCLWNKSVCFGGFCVSWKTYFRQCLAHRSYA